MKNGIGSVMLVSDGILVGFNDGTQCYYSAPFLEEHVGTGSNQVFLTYDPSEIAVHVETKAQIGLAALPC